MATKTTAKSSCKSSCKSCAKKCASKPKNIAAAARAQYDLSIPAEYEPISMWGYFGYEFLFAIPVVGWIICISFAFMAHNVNLRNFARSQFCYLIIYIIIICVLAGLGVLSTVFESLGMI